MKYTKRFISYLFCVLFCLLFIKQTAVADFYDPMQPPAYALNKLRLEKVKKASVLKPARTGVKKAAPWVLSSILYSKQRKHAIINNKLVKKGDVIKGARLVRLGPDSVRLLAKGKTIDLTLGSRFKSIKKSRNKRKL